MPKILGNADPMHYLQSLPQVVTNNEYDAGIHIQGCDNGMNYVMLDGAPVYNAGHLFGLFSVFNPLHYKQVEMTTSATSSHYPNRVGGAISVNSADTIAKKVGGEVSIGPMSTQASCCLPLTATSMLVLSGRLSYLNLLYGSWLSVDDFTFKYSFTDVNATYLWQPRNNEWFSASVYIGNDNVVNDISDYNTSIKVEWGNVAVSAKWRRKTHKGDYVVNGFASSFQNNLNVMQAGTSLQIPSSITTFGLKGGARMGRWSWGGEALYHALDPQSPEIRNYYLNLTNAAHQRSFENTIYTDYLIGNHVINAKVGFKISSYLSNVGNVGPRLSPVIVASYNGYNGWEVFVAANRQQQYLFQSGVSSSGLPMEFWMGASDYLKPMNAYELSMILKKNYPQWGYAFSMELFYKKIDHLVEYTGDLLDFKLRNYRLEDYVVQGKGENRGVSVMAQKYSGRLTGWVSYTWLSAKRTVAPFGTFPADYERPHEVKAVGMYKLKKWDFGATFTYASGTPFTAPTSFYGIDGNVVSEFAERNKNRLPAYSRLDVSVNHVIKRKGSIEHGFNISIYNVLNHSNPIYYRLRLKKDDSFSYRPVRFALRVMPSVNYYFRF